MLINLTHHPAANWSEEQTRAAVPYGEIVDLAFPQIAPEAEIDEIARLARQYVERCAERLGRSREPQNAVHVMGEMTFVYQFVRQAGERGILCLASTTRRVVDWDDAGNKISRFEFVRFRAYETRIRKKDKNQ